MTYTIEADIEQFTEADAESLEFATEDLEGLETESIESISLEDVNPESVVESLESLMEGAEANGYGNGYTRPSPSSSVNKQLLKTFTIIVKKLVKKIMSNPRTRAKLQAATRKGPTAVARLLTPSVAKVLPSYFRWMAPIYVTSVTLALFGPLRKQAGVKAEEVEEAPEFIQFLPWIFRAVSLGLTAYKTRKRR
ncbi:hypothetical protein PQG02_35885 (plasmid) [Nostoc sp. UHCC 0926]|uniref:hypothetical protein n=1 Tax=Nostoc sp. UHCC 0926 TaxID=3025190 RepID=UPI00236287C4|nr:hypothetical protein [Nostoc sp. UHCC 0926]WDD36524.1 hypothetical protein PQG02_35885 [Nostoc sp. UHCC 0926]